LGGKYVYKKISFKYTMGTHTIRQELVSTESFIIASPFLTVSPDSFRMDNQSAQKSVLLRVFLLLRSLLLRVQTVQSELTIRQQLVSTESFIIASPFLTVSPDSFRMDNQSAQKSVLLRLFILLWPLLLQVSVHKSINNLITKLLKYYLYFLKIMFYISETYIYDLFLFSFFKISEQIDFGRRLRLIEALRSSSNKVEQKCF